MYNASLVGIEYKVIEYKNFKCRAVIMDGKPIGQYHIAIRRNNIGLMMSKLNKVDTSSSSVIDPDNTLNLEYVILLKVDGLLAQEALFDTLSDIDYDIST